MTFEEEPKKRKLSKWQLYLKGCIKDQPKESGLGEKVSACSIGYKELKEKNPKYLDDLVNNAEQEQK